MPPILVPSSVKPIAAQILVITKLNGRKYFTLRGFVALFLISSVPARNYPFKVSNCSTRIIRCENCSRLRMKTLEQCQWRRSSVFNVNCEHISNVALIVEFEQTNIPCVML